MDPELWSVNIYGGALADHYDRAVIVRPMEGITQEHLMWVATQLAPLVSDVSKIIPIHWSHDEVFSISLDL